MGESAELRTVPCPRTDPHLAHRSDETPGNPGSPLGPPVRCPGVPATAACDCNRAMMAALSPMHPFHYIELACDEHRREFQQASLADSIRDYEPHNLWRTP